MSVGQWSFASAFVVSLSLLAPAVAAGQELSLRIPDETAPPGGMVQMKVLTTEVTPISGGRPGFSIDANTFGGVAGFGIFDANGEVAGAAVVNGNHVDISYVTTSALTGNYPLLTVVLPIRPDAVRGTQTLFSLDPSSLFVRTDTGPVSFAPMNPATVTVGGTVSITDVIPGQGPQPAGTVVSIRGVGFGPRTRLKVNDTLVTRTVWVSSTEIRVTLAAATDMTGKRIDVVNPDGSRDTYYSYMRGIPARLSARPLLASTEPIFSGALHTAALLGSFGPLSTGRYAGIALQNPTQGPVDVLLGLFAADGTVLHVSATQLKVRQRLALEASELLDGVAVPQDGFVLVLSSAPISMFSLICDEGTGTVTPTLALLSK